MLLRRVSTLPPGWGALSVQPTPRRRAFPWPLFLGAVIASLAAIGFVVR
jgi:hypothetical protein